jgi:hypothetical protein
MNDKGKGKIAMKASPSSPTPPNPFSPMPAFFKKPEILSKGKGKSKEQDEPLPGGLFFSFPPNIHLTEFPHLRVFGI